MRDRSKEMQIVKNLIHHLLWADDVGMAARTSILLRLQENVWKILICLPKMILEFLS